MAPKDSPIPRPDEFFPIDSPLDNTEHDSLIRSTSPPRQSSPPPQNGFADHSQNGDAHPPSYISKHPRPPAERRQSSFAQPRATPRTSNRVRFDVDQPRHQSQTLDTAFVNGHLRNISVESGGSHGSHGSISFLEDFDPLYNRPPGEAEDEDDSMHMNGYTDHRGQRLPLLTGVEAPSVTLATGEHWGDESEFRPESLLESARPKSNQWSAFMNMANSIIGAGIIGQPYALRQAGLISGVILLVGLTVIVDWTIRLIVINSKLSGANSFQATMQKCFGRSGLVAISLAQWLFAFGGMVAFCVIVGDTIPQVIASTFPTVRDTPFLWLLTDRRAIILIVILGISYPLSLYRDISKLAKASTLALFSMLIIILTVITQGAHVPSDSKGAVKGSLLINGGFFQAICVISFAFVCHHNSLLIYGSLRKPTLDRFARVTHYSTAISMLACLTMALAGFLTFGDKTDGNVLNNFPTSISTPSPVRPSSSDSNQQTLPTTYIIMVNIARLCFGLNMITTLPLECFVCREVMVNFWFPHESFNYARHMIFTTALCCTAAFMALLTCDLGIVFELIGATSAVSLAYILPPLCYITLIRRAQRREARMGGSKVGTFWLRKEVMASCAVIAFGSAVMVISLFGAMAKMIRHEGGVKQCNAI